MAHVKSWLLPQTEELRNHSNPHIFRFYRNIDGHAEMKYKDWNNEIWEPNGNQSGLKLLKVMIHCIIKVAAFNSITEIINKLKPDCSH